MDKNTPVQTLLGSTESTTSFMDCMICEFLNSETEPAPYEKEWLAREKGRKIKQSPLENKQPTEAGHIRNESTDGKKDGTDFNITYNSTKTCNSTRFCAIGRFQQFFQEFS